MRLIDADVLKKYIDDCKCCEKCSKKMRNCNDDCEFPDFLTKQWERVIDEQPTVEAEPKWIPITERLPDYYERVLVFTRFDGVHVGFRGMIGDKDYYFLGGIDKRVGLGTIRAWMPILQPYEEKEE